MKKRRVLSLLSILLVSLLFSPHTFSQQTPETVVRVAPRPLSDNDSHLKVDIVIENGQAVTAYQVMLQYDSDYIEYIDIDHGNYLPDDAYFGDAQVRDTDPNDSLKAILFAASAFPNQSEGDGVLATLTFETKIAVPSDLTLLDVTRLSHDMVNNKVVVSSPQLENSRTTASFICPLSSGKVGRVAYSPDGTILAAGEEDRDVDDDTRKYFHFWNASTGEHLYTASAAGNIYGMAFSPDGRWFAIGTDGGTLWVWERDPNIYSTWLEMLRIPSNSSRPKAATINVPRSGPIGAGHLNDITSVAFSQNGERLAIGTGRHDIFVSEYDSGTGTWDDWDDNTLLVPDSESIVRSVAFHPKNSNILASGYEDGRVRIWDLTGYKNKNKVHVPQVLSGDAPVYSIAFNPNGDYLATAGMFTQPSGSGHPGGGSTNTSYRIALWKNQNNQWVNHTYLFTNGRHDTDVLSVAFDPSKDVLLSGDKNGNIHAWGVPLGNHLGRIHHSDFSDISSSDISSIAFNSQSNAGAVGTETGEVYQFTFDDQFTFNVSNQALTQTNVTINDCPKVHVIWYHAANETIRGPEAPIDSLFFDDYISPNNNVKENLKDVQAFFERELGPGTTFKFALDNNKDIKVEYIQSDNFFVHDGLLTSYSECDHFQDNEGSPAGFLHNVWSDITTNHGNSVSSYNTSNDIYLVLVQSNHGYLGATIDRENERKGSRGKVDKIGGRIAMVALGPFEEEWNNEIIKLTIAHELGHNFGLVHDFRKEGSIMAYNWEEVGGLWIPPFKNERFNTNWLSRRSKNWLKVHPAFKNECNYSADNPIEIKVRDASQTSQTPITLRNGQPTWESLAGPTITLSPNSNGEYKIHLKLEDLDGIHHVELIAPSLKSYKGCNSDDGCGDARSVAEFRYSSKPLTRANTEFDVTELITEYPERIAIIIATIDDGGNIWYLALWIKPSSASGPAPLAQKHLPKETALLVNYPNPFNPETWIPYQLATPADVSLTIYDIQGGVVRDLDLGHQRAGMYQTRARAAYWDGRNAVGEPVASGVYFYTLTAGDFTATRKMLILK